MKTKKIDLADLPASSFAYVGDESDTDTWKLPIHFFSDNAKTRNHVKNALTRFPDTKGIPDVAREHVWFTLVGAAKALGIRIEPREFAPQPEVIAQQPEPALPGRERHKIKTQQKEQASDIELAASIAAADMFADRMLRRLGYDD